MHTRNFTYRERSDIFLEVFGNTFLRESTSQYIDIVIPFLDDLIAKETKHVSALNQLIDLKELRFKDRDEMTEVIRSWHSYHEFKIEKLRD
jgi:dynein assembly factor 3